MSKLVAGQEVEVPGFIIKPQWGHPTHATHEMTEHGYITIMPYTLKFTVPDDFNPVAAQVAALEAAREKLRKEFNARINQIEDEISKLQAICYDAPEVKE